MSAELKVATRAPEAFGCEAELRTFGGPGGGFGGPGGGFRGGGFGGPGGGFAICFL